MNHFSTIKPLKSGGLYWFPQCKTGIWLVACLVGLFCNANAQTFKETIALHRQQYLNAFLTGGHSPLKKEDLRNVQFFAADSIYAVTAKVSLLQNEAPFEMATFDGAAKTFVRFALLTFELLGKPYQLTVYKSPAMATNPIYKDYLFLPFNDLTNNKETYGGGRYIDLDAKRITGNTIDLDFNKAYNPYCAYSIGYQCPVPPIENELAIPVLAGEKNFVKSKKP